MRQRSIWAIVPGVVLLAFFVSEASWISLPAGTAQAWAIGADATGTHLWLGLARGGFWQTQDGGATWLPSNDLVSPGDQLVPLDVIALDHSGDTLVLRTSTVQHRSQVWYSYNAGASWVHFPDWLLWSWPGDFMAFWRVNHDVMLHCDGQVFQRSIDGGQSWTTFQFPETTIGPVHGLVQDPSSDSTLFIPKSYVYGGNPGRGFGGLCRSDDLGETWRQVTDLHELFGLTSATVEDVVRLSDGSFLLPVNWTVPNWENGTLLRSTDGGESWTRVFGGLPDRFQPNRIIEDPMEPGTLFIAGNGQKYGLYWSHNYGLSWARCLNGLPANVGIVNNVQANPFSGAIYAAYTGFGVYVTHDHGQSWQAIPMPPVGSLGDLGVTSETVFERDDGYRAWRLDPSQNEWTEIPIPLIQDTLVMMRPMCYHNGDTLVSALAKRNANGPATDVFQMTYSYDNGSTWQNDPFLPWVSLPYYFKVYRSENVVRFVDLEPGVLRWSEDLGHTWQEVSHAAGFWPTGSVVQNDSEFFVTVVDSDTYVPEVVRSVDGGHSWQELFYPGPLFENPMPVLIGDALHLIADSNSWLWHDGTWMQRGVVPDHEFLSYLITIPHETGTLMFGVSFRTNQSWLSVDSGTTWQTPTVVTPYPDQGFGFTDLQWNGARQQVWAVHALGTCYLPIEELEADGPLEFVPAELTLLSCYPNPFNSQTNIRFDLTRTAYVRLNVYDLTGRLVCSLADEWREAGRHVIILDGTRIATGLYFVRLNVGEDEHVQRLVLLK